MGASSASFGLATPAGGDISFPCRLNGRGAAAGVRIARVSTAPFVRLKVSTDEIEVSAMNLHDFRSVNTLAVPTKVLYNNLRLKNRSRPKEEDVGRELG